MALPRLLVYGHPARRKTERLIATAPRPLADISAPGEKGHDTVPDHEEGVQKVVLQKWDDKGRLKSSEQILQDTRQTVLGLIAKGNLQTLAFEGFGKYLEYWVDAVTGGLYFKGEEFNGWQKYPQAYRGATGFLDEICMSRVPLVVVTAWELSKKDRKKMKGEDEDAVPTHIWPDLLGQFSRDILGEFPCVFHQSLRKETPLGEGIPVWQTRPDGTVGGARFNVPSGRAQDAPAIPLYIPADYGQFLTRWKEVRG